jgi:hypothetical protein
MDAFTISFWKDPVSKDDSATELHDLHEAGLVHATVNRTNHDDSTRYAIDMEDNELKEKFGRIVLAKSPDNKWKVITSLNSIEDIFLQLTDAIESAEVESN